LLSRPTDSTPCCLRGAHSSCWGCPWGRARAWPVWRTTPGLHWRDGPARTAKLAALMTEIVELVHFFVAIRSRPPLLTSGDAPNEAADEAWPLTLSSADHNRGSLSLCGRENNVFKRGKKPQSSAPKPRHDRGRRRMLRWELAVELRELLAERHQTKKPPPPRPCPDREPLSLAETAARRSLLFGGLLASPAATTPRQQDRCLPRLRCARPGDSRKPRVLAEFLQTCVPLTHPAPGRPAVSARALACVPTPPC